MTTTVNKPGWGWDDEPAKTISPIKASPAKKEDGAWVDDEQDKKAPEPVRRKIKTSELPLSSATRTAIEGLSHKFKKKGGYDAIRKQVWGQLEGSDFERELVEKVKNVAIETLESNPSLLSSTRKKSAILVEGHIERSEVYQEAENYIRNLLREQHMDAIESGIRALRVAEIGELNADVERKQGSKTDEEYERELQDIRRERERLRKKERREKEAAEKKERAERERIAKVEDEKRRREREAREIAREVARKEKREALAKAYEGQSTSANTTTVGSRDRGRYEDRGLGRGRGGSRGRGDGSRGRGGSAGRSRSSRENSHGGRRPSATPRVEKILTREEQERLEREAMAELLRDGKKANRNRYQAELEIDETLAPPPRKAMPSSAIKPIDRDPPPVKKELVGKQEEREAKAERPPSRFDVKTREDIDRRDRPRERSRDRGYARRGSGDRGERSRRSSRSRDRLDRRRSRSRDARRRDDRIYDDRERDRRSTRDARDTRDGRDTHGREMKRDSRFDDRTARRRSPARSRSRSPRKESISSTARPIPPIDPDRDPVLGLKDGAPTGRKFIDREAEEKKLIEIRTREAEARAFLQLREEAKAKNLPMPGYEHLGIERELSESRRERRGSGTPGLRDSRDGRASRPDWRSQGGGPSDNRRREVDAAGFATPGPRERSFGDRGRRESTSLSLDRPPSRTEPGSVFRSRENTPVPGGPVGARRESGTGNRTLTDIPLEAKARGSATSQVRDGKAEQPSPALTRHSRRDSTEAGEIVAGVPDTYGGGRSVRRKSRSRSRDRRRDGREKPRGDSRDRRSRREERGEVGRDTGASRGVREDRRDGRRDDRRPRSRSRSRERERRYRSRSRDSRRPRDSGRSFGARR